MNRRAFLASLLAVPAAVVAHLPRLPAAAWDAEPQGLLAGIDDGTYVSTYAGIDRDAYVGWYIMSTELHIHNPGRVARIDGIGSDE